MFLSKSYLRMPHCDMGMKHAMNYNCTCFAVYLEDVDLSRKAALEMGLRPANNLYKFKMPEEEFLQSFAVPRYCRSANTTKTNPTTVWSCKEEPIKRAPLEYGLLGVLIFLMLALAFLQSSWYLGYLGTNISAIPQVFLFFYSFSLLRQEESLYQCTTTRNSPASTMALLLLCLSYGMLLPRLAHGGTWFRCVSAFSAASSIFAADSCDKRQKVAAQRRQQFSAMLHRPHSLPVPHAVHVRLPISLGSMRTVLSHLRRAARNVWTNLQRTGAKRTPQLCDSGGCGLLMLLCAVTGFVLLSPLMTAS